MCAYINWCGYTRSFALSLSFSMNSTHSITLLFSRIDCILFYYYSLLSPNFEHFHHRKTGDTNWSITQTMPTNNLVKRFTIHQNDLLTAANEWTSAQSQSQTQCMHIQYQTIPKSEWVEVNTRHFDSTKQYACQPEKNCEMQWSAV